MNNLSEFINIAIDATLIVDERGIIQEANSRLEKLLGYSHQEMIGQPVEILMPKSIRKGHVGLRNSYVKTPSLREMGEYVDLVALNKSKEKVHVSIGLSPFIAADGERLILATIRDNTQLYEARIQAEDYIAELKNISETAIDGIITINSESKILSWNAAATLLFGYSQKEAIGQSVSIIIPKAMRKGHLNGVSNIASGGKGKLVGSTVEVEGLRKNGIVFPLSLSISTWMSGHGRVFCGILRDITEQREAEKKILEQRDQLELIAVTDPLTGAFNRRQYEVISKQEFARNKRYKKGYALLMLDIDHFKVINDTYGHDVGDQAIKNTALVIKEGIRQSDNLFRIGGEEFIVLLPETKLETALKLAERLRKSISEIAINSSSTEANFTASIGVSEFSPVDIDMAETLKRADDALYIAKSSGRNRIQYL